MISSEEEEDETEEDEIQEPEPESEPEPEDQAWEDESEEDTEEDESEDEDLEQVGLYRAELLGRAFRPSFRAELELDTTLAGGYYRNSFDSGRRSAD